MTDWDKGFFESVWRYRDAMRSAGIDTPEKARLVYDTIRLRTEMTLPQRGETLGAEGYAALLREFQQ